MENFAKSVLKAMMSKVMLFAIPIIVFFIGLVMALSVGDSSSSSSASDNDNYGNMSATGTTILGDFIAGWEDSIVWQYLNADANYSDYLKKVITEDKKYFICYTDGRGDKNYGYGVCHYYIYNGTSYWNNVDAYQSEGINIKESKYNNIGSSKLDVNIVLNVYEKEVENKKNYVKNKTEGLNLSENQINALTSIAYQYGNIGNFVEMYKKYGNTEQLRQNAEASRATYSKYFVEVKPGGDNAKKRGEANWKLFHEGKYIVQYGELDPSSYNNSSNNSSDDSSTDSVKTDNAKRNKIISLAKSKIGCRYSLGNKGPNVFDCSGFANWLYKQIGISVPGSTGSYKSYIGGKKEISIDKAQPGDILHVLNTERGTTYGHVAIYLDKNTTIEAMNQSKGVCKGSISNRFKRAFNFIDK